MWISENGDVMHMRIVYSVYRNAHGVQAHSLSLQTGIANYWPDM